MHSRTSATLRYLVPLAAAVAARLARAPWPPRSTPRSRAPPVSHTLLRSTPVPPLPPPPPPSPALRLNLDAGRNLAALAAAARWRRCRRMFRRARWQRRTTSRWQRPSPPVPSNIPREPHQMQHKPTKLSDVVTADSDCSNQCASWFESDTLRFPSFN